MKRSGAVGERVGLSSFAELCPPPGIYRLREQTYRDRYDRERAAEITTEEGVSWPIDLGEAGC
jgi:hypothetical protein